jgi:hypothetical protein
LKILPSGARLNLSFALPEDYVGHTYILLYWDETLHGGLGGWVEIPFHILYGDAQHNQRITDWFVYLRSWDAYANNGAGDWVTLVETATLWDSPFSSTMGGWVEIDDLTDQTDETMKPDAILTASVEFTGVFVLVSVP